MASTCSLVFQNKSTNSGSAVVYQTDPDGNPQNLSLAWFSKNSRPNTNVVFEWKTDYSFVWSETGRLVPGVVFQAAQNWPADPASSNAVTFTHQYGNFSFMNQTQGPQPGSLYIRQDSALPMNQAAVGIGMSGAGTFVNQARPNMNLTFTPNPQYWIAFGDYQQGQVLDTGAIDNAARIQFPAGVSSMTATLTPDNRWTIQRS
jgi:hypothetical protein